MTDTGHNSGAVNAGRLRSFIERAERLEEEVRALNSDKSEVFQEAKGEGYDVKAIKHIIAMRRKPQEKRIEEQAILDVYMSALGLVD